MKKHVQTVVSEVTYEKLRRRAEEEKRPLKDLVRDAVEDYLDERHGSDPLDEVVGILEIGGDWSTRKNWRSSLEGRGSDRED